MSIPLRGAVIVVTGASSGIGRATAHAFAGHGARLVLAARRALPLEEAARDCRDRSGTAAIAVPTDVADAAAVEALAATALEEFGRIDIWVNNAGAGVIGPFAEVPLALHRRTIETNLMGALHGCAAALPAMLRQRRGLVVNMASMGAWAPTPFAAAYAASKFGIRGLSASLRAELGDRRGVHVCAVFPAIVDTPGVTAHAANFTGREVTPDAGPILAAEAVAEAVLRLARRPRAEVAVGWPSMAAKLAYALAPGLTERAGGAMMRAALRRAGRAPRTEGALMRPIAEGTGTGGGIRSASAQASAQRGGTGRMLGLALGGVALLVGAEMAARRFAA